MLGSPSGVNGCGSWGRTSMPREAPGHVRLGRLVCFGSIICLLILFNVKCLILVAIKTQLLFQQAGNDFSTIYSRAFLWLMIHGFSILNKLTVDPHICPSDWCCYSHPVFLVSLQPRKVPFSSPFAMGQKNQAEQLPGKDVFWWFGSVVWMNIHGSLDHHIWPAFCWIQKSICSTVIINHNHCRKSKKIKFPKTDSGRKRLRDGLEFIHDQGFDTKECWTLGQTMRSSVVWWLKSCQHQFFNQLSWCRNLPDRILFHYLRVVDCAASKKFQGNPSYEVRLGSKLIDTIHLKFFPTGCLRNHSAVHLIKIMIINVFLWVKSIPRSYQKSLPPWKINPSQCNPLIVFWGPHVWPVLVEGVNHYGSRAMGDTWTCRSLFGQTTKLSYPTKTR